MRCFKPFLLTIVIMLFVVARGGNDANAVTLTAVPNLGVVINATVNFFASDGTTLLGMGDTGADGSVTIDVGTYSGFLARAHRWVTRGQALFDPPIF